MSDADGDSKLVRRAETTVAEAPLREPDWEAMALKVEASLGKAGPTDDTLLLPPLPESIEDGQLEVAVAATDASHDDASANDGASLADLARAAIARRGAKESVNLAKESLAIASQGRGSVEATAPTIVIERERTTVPPAARARPAIDTRGPWIGVAVAAVGLAAGFGLYLASQRTPTQVVERAAPEAARPAPTLAPAPTPTPARVVAEAPHPTPEALPAEQVAPPAAAEPTPIPAEALAAERGAAKPSGAAVEARSAQAATPSPARAEKVVLEEEHGGTAKAAGGAPRPEPTPAMRPAELDANGASGMSERPTTGAAQAAVGAVLGAARSCLAGQPQASSAAIVFGSSGQVTSVSVSGPAEGTPAAGCIQGALSKARVQPFAAKSFSLGVTVRPP
jgi:hypothetical protein